MEELLLHAFNPNPARRSAAPLSLGVPVPCGRLRDDQLLALATDDGRPLPLQTRPLARWPDGSIRWLLCDFQADLPAAGAARFRLRFDGTPAGGECIRLERGAGQWRIDTGAARFEIDTCILRPFTTVQVGGAPAATAGAVLVRSADGRELEPRIDAMTVEACGPVRCTLALSGACGDLLRFETRLHFYAGTARVRLELRLHNPAAATHPGNLWDLGDPASVLLREWSLRLPLTSARPPALRLQVAEGEAWREIDTASGGCLLQHSSGGEQWDSPVHRDRDGRVPQTHRGWTLSGGGMLMAEGLRAQPLAKWGQVAGTIDHFWQRFPKGIALAGDGLHFHLLPAEFPAPHELQGGEQITEIIRLDFAVAEASAWGGAPVLVRCAPEAYAAAGVFPGGLHLPAEPRHAALVAVALADDRGFHAKREAVDEYGWRHFGELPADHEAAFCRGEKPFVSHYNNQYDALASLYRQFLAGGVLRWGELAADLAAHVADIDINHTDADREEYCHGLFWHTDHYLDAGLATHRMASREHLTQKNPAFCGGGPAAEHCYSGGLTLHHLHTGDPRARELVVRLADWCWLSLRGPQTLGAALLRAKKAVARWRRERPAAPVWARFPFTRGTGNCLNSTLDALLLTGERRYMARATELVRGTVHPADDPGERDLLNAEIAWSYTVMLAALGRYLQTKREWREQDADYHHALGSLLTYARWMAQHEYPYLDRPAILEYPNETWAGQDLRKGVIFYYAAVHAQGAERERFLERSRFFLDAGFAELLRHDTHHNTRPLALVLQNGWTTEALADAVPIYAEEGMSAARRGRATSRLTLAEVLHRSLADLLAVLPQTGPLRELRWLRMRLGKD